MTRYFDFETLQKLTKIVKLLFFGYGVIVPIFQIKSNQIKSLLLSHHHSTSALVSEILMSVLQTVQKEQQTINIWTDSAKKQQTIYIWTDSAKKQQTIYIWTDSAKKQQQFTYGQTVQKNNNNLHMDRQCKKTTNN